MHVINKDMPEGLNKEISVMPYEDAKSIYDSQKEGNIKFKTNFMGALDEDTFGEKVLAGVQNQAQSLEQIKEAPRLIWGEAQVALSNLPQWMMGAASISQAELRKTGAMNIQTANRNIETMRKRQQAEKIQLKDEKNFVTMATSVGTQYGMSLALALIPVAGPAASLGFIVSQEASGTAIEGLEQYKREHPEDKELKGFIDEKVTKELLLNAGKTFTNAVGEYILGAPAQVRRAGKMADLAKRGFKPQKYGALRYIGKNAAIGAAQEFAEEGLIQGTSDTVFDYLLDRYKTKDEAVMAWKENLVDSLYAGMFGGTFGMAGAINARAKGIEATRNLLKDVVPAEDLNKVATVVFENELKEARDVATVALEINSQLNAQKGEIYDAFRNAAFQAIKESGGYKGLTDESLWSHANEVSERFSQEAVAEAFKRKVPIQEVIDSSDIVYKDGELHLAKATGESNLGKQIGDAIQKSKMMKEQSALQQTMYQLDQENPEYTGNTLNINGVEKTVYNSDGAKIAQSEPALRAFYNWFGDSKVVDEQGRPLVVYHGTNAEFDTFDKRKIGGAHDKGFYGSGFYFSRNKGEAGSYGSNVMPVYLKISNPFDLEGVDSGKYSGMDNIFEKGAVLLRNLGLLDDEQLKKLDFYEKTKKEFLNKIEVFPPSENQDVWFGEVETQSGQKILERAWESDNTKDGLIDVLWNKYTRYIKYDDGTYFQNILDGLSFTGFMRDDGYRPNEFTEKLEKLGYDGVYQGDEFVAFNPNQIKSISNRGTYSLTEDNIYKQVQGLGINAPVRRGSYDANSKVIKLFENANTSTLPHELAHYWLDNMWNYAKSGNANPQYVAQFNAVRNFLGVKPDQENLTRAQHEKFASAYEKYLYRGEFPTPIMGTVFANYERFIRDVYQSINDIRAQSKSKVRLTPEIIQFFDSMTSGELTTDLATTEMLNETRAEEVHQYDSKVVEEVKKEVKQPDGVPNVALEATTPQEILPVGSSGEVAESRLAKRTAESMGMESDLQYERANIEKEREKAAEMWKNDPQKAQAELNNATMGNEVLRNALYTEQQRIALENGDRDTFLKSLRKQSAEATRAGQELAALRGVVEDITMPSYWIRLAEWEAQKQLAKNMATYFDKVMGNTPLLNFTQKFDADVKALYEKVRKAETNAEKSKIMKEGLDEMKKTYRGLNQQEVGELFQTDWTNEELAYDYVEKKARDAVGLNLTNEKANAIIQASRDLDKLSRNVDEFGLPTAQFFAKKSELEYLINSHTPSSQAKVLLSTLGRANMLTAPATSVLNVASNVQNYGAQTLVRRLNNTITGHTNDNLVDSNLRKQYRKRVWDTFWATGYDLSMMNSIADTRLYRGESAVNSAGEGVIRQAGQWAEKHIFGELISSPDMVFKSYLAFTDFAGNEATDIAYKEGLTGDKAKARANELFTDAVKIEPKTEIGKQIRAKAQADALVITFQQDTKLARALLDLRNIVNKATGDVGVGDLLSAFVKTPANVLALGYDATVGPFGHLVNTFGAIQDARAGNLTSARVLSAIKQTTTMAVMQSIVAAFALGFIDDDDYIPDYSQLSPSERLIVKERGASFGSIRIGDTYISTDFFGPFEVPLTAWLNARRQQGFADSASAYIGSVLRKGLDAPVIKDLLDQAKAAENVGSDSLSIWEHIYDTAGNLLISRLTPNVMNTLAKMTDDYERETNKSVLNKLIARVPVARKTLAPKMSVSTGKPVETPSALMQLLFGSRAHKLVDSTVSNELYRLYQAGERATISDITRSGDLKLIDEKDKQSAKEWFAREYSKAAERAIKTSTYRRKSDEDKKDELNKIRRDLVKQLKEKYKKKISVAKQKK